MFSHINRITLHVAYIVKGQGNLPPYLGSTIRGVIGHSLRNIVCNTPKVKCYACDFASDCEYANYFVSPKNVAGSVNRMILRPLTMNKTNWVVGDICEFEITLIGITNTEIALIIEILKNVEKKGWGAARIPFSLLKITNSSNNRLIWYNNTTWLNNVEPSPISVMEHDSSMIFMYFQTPLRLEKSKKLLLNPTFENIIEAIARRLSLLSHAYASFKMEWNYEDMLHKAREIEMIDCEWKEHTFSRYSMNQKGHKLEMDTLTGWVCYKGDITPFTPLLEAGQIIHIGRNATHGFGYYTINYV